MYPPDKFRGIMEDTSMADMIKKVEKLRHGFFNDEELLHKKICDIIDAVNAVSEFVNSLTAEEVVVDEKKEEVKKEVVKKEKGGKKNEKA